MFLFKPWRLTGFFQFDIIMNVLVSSPGLFEYLCYGSTTIINSLILLVLGPFYTSESDVYRRQILTYKN